MPFLWKPEVLSFLGLFTAAWSLFWACGTAGAEFLPSQPLLCIPRASLCHLLLDSLSWFSFGFSFMLFVRGTLSAYSPQVLLQPPHLASHTPHCTPAPSILLCQICEASSPSEALPSSHTDQVPASSCHSGWAAGAPVLCLMRPSPALLTLSQVKHSPVSLSHCSALASVEL